MKFVQYIYIGPEY
ncbi:hypothetical protein MACJ_003670 [Theileria orientalis]|uniref:Uncharacterized protein n=1 Tax=Theileria orientalis TaxID=68886 RepID=A0A976SL58_THEOR|nr:hypothetical protein MACJ_003670 [Theileria orientalis]